MDIHLEQNTRLDRLADRTNIHAPTAEAAVDCMRSVGVASPRNPLPKLPSPMSTQIRTRQLVVIRFL